MVKSIITATRRIQFCAGHRVFGHESKCANMHGHNYVVLVTAQASLDAIGRVIDFSVLKEKIGGWIDRWWDHGFLYFKDDIELVKLFEQTEHGEEQKSFVMMENPTAENIAQYLLDTVCPEQLEGTGVTVTKVVVWETENCYAEAKLE